MSQRKRTQNPKGSSKIHGIAMFDDTWRDFKEFKDYYDLSGDAAMTALLNNWNAMQLDKKTKDFIKENARTKSEELTTEQKIKRAKMLSSHNTLKEHGMVVDRSSVIDKPVASIFDEDPVNLDKFI